MEEKEENHQLARTISILDFITAEDEVCTENTIESNRWLGVQGFVQGGHNMTQGVNYEETYGGRDIQWLVNEGTSRTWFRFR
ncbi:unnamed protein product [Lathyrus oleraceus]